MTKQLLIRDGWLRLKGGVEIAGLWIDERDHVREIERLQQEVRSQHAAYQRMFDKAAELERRLSGELECRHPWVEPDTGRCLGCGDTVRTSA